MPFGRKGHLDVIKRSSYYVCFIGAKESPVVRDHHNGHEFVFPAMQYLLRTLVEAGPLANAAKITLQVSGKGLKIVQNVSRQSSGGRGIIGHQLTNPIGKTETLKHFIPHHAITCAYQGPPPYDDLVATTLLIYNPATRCPVHIHVYRCDSRGTASILTQQLQLMSERPENQAKFIEIEGRLSGRGLLPHFDGFHLKNSNPASRTSHSVSMQSDGGSSSSGRASISPETNKPQNRNSSSLKSSTDSSKSSPLVGLQEMSKLTAELQQKLSARNAAPLLLPPKDYDTVNRSRGKIGITLAQSETIEETHPDNSHKGRSNLTPSKSVTGQRAHSSDDDDEDWTVENNDKTRSSKIEDFDLKTYEERLKMYSSLEDVFGERSIEKTERETITNIIKSKVPVLGAPPPATPVSSDSNAAYRPRPYYFHMDSDGIERTNEYPRPAEDWPKDKSGLQIPSSRIERELSLYRKFIDSDPRESSLEQPIVVASRHNRPSLPLKGHQRPVVNERLRPASFYERIRFDDRDFEEGRFISPEMFYYQYRS